MKKQMTPDQINNLIDKVAYILKHLNLYPIYPIKTIVNDKTRNSYTAIVVNKSLKKMFIKIRLINSYQEKENYKKILQISKIAESEKLPLNQFLPKLIDSHIDGKHDYLLYKYYDGEILGSRISHDVFKLKTGDIDQLLTIIDAIKQFPINHIYRYCHYGDYQFYYYKVFKEVKVSESALKPYISINQSKLIKNIFSSKNVVRLLNQSAKYFQHGDFQTPNLIRTTNGLLITDFDQAFISNRYYDLAHIYNHGFRKPHFRQKLLTKSIPVKNLTNEQTLIYFITRLAVTYVWIKLFIKRRDLYITRQLKDLSIRKKAFKIRLNDADSYLGEIGKLI